MGNSFQLDMAKCKHFRIKQDGTVIYLIDCPSCLIRLGKKDSKRKLGVAVLDNRVTWTKCLRCGAKPQVTVTGKHAPPKPRRLATKATGATRMAYAATLTDSPILTSIEQRRASCGIWQGLSSADLAQAGAEYDDNASQVHLPYLSLADGPGWISRNIPWEGSKEEVREGGRGECKEKDYGEGVRKSVENISIKNDSQRVLSIPKVVSSGPKGPAYLPYALGDIPVIVEGVADGIAIPPPYFPVVLLGTGNWERIPCNQQYILALDGDTAGRTTARALIRKILAHKCRVSVVILPDNCDPASVGRVRMKEMLAQSLDVPSLAVMLSILGETTHA